MEVFAIVFLFAIIGLIIYFFIYRANKNIKHQSDQALTNEFLDSETEEIDFLEFGFPENAENIFKGRHIDAEKGIAVIKNRSHFGIALCVHARLSYTRLYFYVDFDHFDRPSPVIFIIGDNEERVMLKVNSESAMFSHDNLRYFDAKIDSKDILNTAKKYLLNPSLSVSGKEYYCDQIKKIWQDRF